MIRNTRVHIAATLLALLTVAACVKSPTGLEGGLTMSMIAGSYEAGGEYGAFELTTIQDGETTDWLAEGASIQLALSADGTTAGRITIPGADEDGSDWEEDLAGSWTLSGDTVHFDHEADTFIRDMPFAVVGSTLVGDRTFGEDVRVRMVLAKE